jgi:hypothetical protein
MDEEYLILETSNRTCSVTSGLVTGEHRAISNNVVGGKAALTAVE